MADAIRDENHVPVLMGVSYLDGTTLVPIQVNSTNGGVKVDILHTIAFTPNEVAVRDQNHVPILMGVDSIDPTKTIPIYADPVTGGILINQI